MYEEGYEIRITSHISEPCPVIPEDRAKNLKEISALVISFHSTLLSPSMYIEEGNI